MMTFPGRQSDADSTMMPAARSWIRNCLEEECISPEDHSVVLWLNCTTIGIIPTLKYDFFLTFLSNVLTDFSKNGVCFIVFPNRASQLDKRTGVNRKLKIRTLVVLTYRSLEAVCKIQFMGHWMTLKVFPN